MTSMNDLQKHRTRFVVLRHKLLENGETSEHLDFMVEQQDAFLTWSLDAWPNPGEVVIARKLVDHRLAYWDYEGPIAGNRGTVLRWDRGACEILGGTSRTEIWLHGTILRGLVQLDRDQAANLTETYRMDWKPQ